MSELVPTESRLALLREVADGIVYESTWFPNDSYEGLGVNGHKVTSRCSELRRAGWVELAPQADRYRRFWALTDAGRAVLDGGAS